MRVQGPACRVPGSRNALLLAIFLIGAVLGPRLLAQQPIRSGTRIVAIYATVIDRGGHLVTNLAKDDFTVYDNGKPQPITLFANDPQPITMAVMLDTSGSMLPNVGLVRNATMALVSHLTPDDRVRLGTFGGRIVLSPAFTNNSNDLARFVWERMSPGGGTPLWDAVDVAMDTLVDRPGRRVVLMFSDGKDSQSRLKLKDVMRRAEQEGFMVYAIGCWGSTNGGRFPMTATLEKPDDGLRKIADQTGGGYAELQWRDDLDASFRRVAEELHSQYMLGFSPEKIDGQLHKLEVRVAQSNYTVRAEELHRRRRQMKINRRKFLGTAAVGGGAMAIAGCAGTTSDAGKAPAATTDALHPALAALKPMRDGIVPITVDERKARIVKAQKLMAEQKIDAIFMEGTTTMSYFVNMRWGQSERTFGVVIPAKGEVAYVCPKFEEDRALELLKKDYGGDVRTWEEHESPYAVIAGIVKDRGVTHHRIGMEERVRFFIADGVRKAPPGFDIVDATPVTAGCRIYKTKSEIALMQHANNVTIVAYQAAFKTMKAGMTQGELAANIAAAHKQLGFSGGASVQVGKWTALPHGSITPQKLEEGQIVMVDGGTSCEGYASDITRTIVLGTPTPRMIEVWNQEKQLQAMAFAAMKLGATCGSVDDAVRAGLVKFGYGPDYKLPGTPHRTGHGIGLEGHEWTNFTKGNMTPLAPGMCFSNEPTISIPGEFGIRIEDCVYMAEDGAHFFTTPSLAIDQPFG